MWQGDSTVAPTITTRPPKWYTPLSTAHESTAHFHDIMDHVCGLPRLLVNLHFTWNEVVDLDVADIWIVLLQLAGRGRYIFNCSTK